MKECPYCTTPIEDDSRFCIHCMKELETKVYYADKIPLVHRSAFFCAVGIFVVIVMVILHILFLPPQDSRMQPSTEPTSSAPTATATPLSSPETQSCRLLAKQSNQRLVNKRRKEQHL